MCLTFLASDQAPSSENRCHPTGWVSAFSLIKASGHHAKSPTTMFPVKHEDARLSAKDKVVGVSIGEHYKAYPLKLFKRRTEPVEDTVGKTNIKVMYNAEADTAHAVEATSGKLLPAIVVYWFAWATFHPESPVYTMPMAAGK